MGDIAYLYRFEFDGFSLTPGVGLLWTSGDYNDYYYGISNKESQKSGLAAYEADDAVSPYLELTADFALSEHVKMYVTGKVISLGDEIADSPMVDQDAKVVMGTGLSYSF